MFNEKDFYEAKPYLIAAVSLYALLHFRDSKIYLYSGIILAVCSALILYMRHINRK